MDPNLNNGNDPKPPALEANASDHKEPETALQTSTDLLRNKVENYPLDAAMVELNNIISNTADLFSRLKRVKFEYLTKTCELHTRIDFPSIMMDASHKEVFQNVPKAQKIDKLEI